MADRPIRDLPVVTDEYDVLQFPVDQNNVAKRVYATDLAQEFSNTVILENTISDMDLSVSMTAEEIYALAKSGQIVLFDSGFLESNSTVNCLFPIHRVEKNGNDYTAFVYVRNDIDDPIYEYAIDRYGNVSLIGEESGGETTEAVLYTEQSLTDYQRECARNNIGAGESTVYVEHNMMYIVDEPSGAIVAYDIGGASGSVLYNAEQNLTEGQKALARQNIGAAAPGEGGGGGGSSYYVLAEDIGLTTEWPTVPSGATEDEQAAIAEQKAAIAGANSTALNQFIASSSAEKTIRFRDGTYHFGTTINITTQTNFVGNGRATVLKFSGTDLFFNVTAYFAPHFYDIILSGINYGTCMKIGTRVAGSDRTQDISSARGIFFNVRVEHFDYGMRFESGWGWNFYSLDAQNIKQFLFHGVGVWNTCNIIGGEYEYQSKGGVLWDENCTSNAVNFIGVVWEALESHVFEVSPKAGSVNATIQGCYFENKYEYNNKVSTAHLIYSPNEKATFTFVGYTSIGYNQTIYSKGLVRNPPQNALLALGAFHQAFEIPTSRFSAIQSPNYNFPTGEVIDLYRNFKTDTNLFPSSDLFPIDARGLHFQALNASFVTYKNRFTAGTPVRQFRLRIPEGLFNLSTVDIGFEFVMPDGVVLESNMSVYCRLMGAKTFGAVSSVSEQNPVEEEWYEKDAAGNYVLTVDTTPVSGKTYYSLNDWSSSQEFSLSRYVPMLGSDVVGIWRKYQAFKRYRKAEVSPTVTINGKKYFEIQMSVNAASVYITKVFIDDGNSNPIPRSLFDATMASVQNEINAIKEMASPYTELDYIESDGASYIDTGITPNANTKIIARFKLASTNIINDAERQYVFGTYSKVIENGVEVVESRVQFYYGGSDTDAASREFIGWGKGSNDEGYKYLNIVPDADTHTASLSGAFMLDGTQHFVLSNSTFDAPKPIYLFACNENGEAKHFSDGMQIEAVSIYDGNTRIARFVPTLRKADSVVGMYDQVSDVFHANQGTGTFLHN